MDSRFGLLGGSAELIDFGVDQVMRGDGATDGADADANATIVEVGDEGLKGMGGLLNGREQTVPWGLFGHGRDAKGRRPKAPGAQGWRPGCRGQERP